MNRNKREAYDRMQCERAPRGVCVGTRVGLRRAGLPKSAAVGWHAMDSRSSYTFHDGDPQLLPGSTFGEQLAVALAEAPLVPCSRGLACSVRWGGCTHAGPFTLMLRRRGVEVVRMVAMAHEPLGIDSAHVDLDLSPGENVIFELQWAEGSRHLHIIP